MSGYEERVCPAAVCGLKAQNRLGDLTVLTWIRRFNFNRRLILLYDLAVVQCWKRGRYKSTAIHFFPCLKVYVLAIHSFINYWYYFVQNMYYVKYFRLWNVKHLFVIIIMHHMGLPFWIIPWLWYDNKDRSSYPGYQNTLLFPEAIGVLTNWRLSRLFLIFCSKDKQEITLIKQ